MKTMEELIKEIDGSKDLQKEFDKIDNNDDMAIFLKKQNCGATAKEFVEFLKTRFEGSISDDDLEFAVGGTGGPNNLAARERTFANTTAKTN